jgi:hypothetical protein
VVGPEEAKLVKRDGAMACRTAETLNTEGMPTKKGRK